MFTTVEWLSPFLKVASTEQSVNMSSMVVMDVVTPVGVQLSAKYKKSFAYFTVNERLPAILLKCAEDLKSNIDEIAQFHSKDAKKDVEIAIKSVLELKDEIKSNKPLSQFTSNGSDVSLWNQFLESQAQKEGQSLKWFDTVWLYVECYMYRRIRQIFELSSTLKSYDHYQKTKESSLLASLDACATLSNYLIPQLKSTAASEEEIKQQLIKLLKLNLWGNRFDMSISLGSTSAATSDPLTLVNQLEHFILADDSLKIWSKLLNIRNKNSTIDFVCDNAGYELFTDLCLADFLVTFGFASRIRFHVKVLPWFVSDAMVHDVTWTVDTLKNAGSHSARLPELGSRWQNHIDSDAWELIPSDFWTLPYEYWAMKEVDPKLYSKLCEAAMILFKGDLNYRKLMGEVNWLATESFHNALQGFHPSNIAALRTIKADVVSGLKPGLAEAAAARDPQWNFAGDYGLIQYDGKSFAYVTVKDRLPVIITRVVDHLARDKDKIIKEYGEDAREELKTVIGQLSELKNELQTNKPLVELKSRRRDAYQWNTFLEDQRKAGHQELRWFGTVWLYAECYMYRRMWQTFELT
uniref:Sugar phosphate phosphatase n=1 Tax=Timema shepardi TaxID=629360 RepID=A0A7R9AZ69_TIMSH|nr:unnamed protein product [Timema shepardi]